MKPQRNLNSQKAAKLGSAKGARAPLATALAAVLVSGCMVAPKPLEVGFLRSSQETTRKATESAQEPLGEALTLDEAIARALKYNLEQRTRLLEESLASSQLSAGRFDMLPRLMANAGYSDRNNDNVRFSSDPANPGQFATDRPFISSEREHTTYDLGLQWNLLDFGASYFTAKQNADRLLIASERRRKAMHTLIQNVRTAYWRALAAEALGEQVRQTIVDGERALANSRIVTAERIKAPVEALRYQRNLLENLRLVESVERELASARIDLANLVGVPPGTRIRLIEPNATTPEELLGPIEQLEEQALLSNADLRESFYNARIAADDTRKALLRLLPGISFDYTARRDDDRFLKNDQWNELGARVSMNLFNLLSGPSHMRAAKRNEQVAETRRMALQMAVIAQVHMARHQYDDALRQFRRADAIFTVDHELERIVTGQQQGQMTGELERIAASVTSILSNVRRFQSMARVQEATGRLQSTLGLEPEIPPVDTAPLNVLQAGVAEWLSRGIGIQIEAAVTAAEMPQAANAPETDMEAELEAEQGEKSETEMPSKVEPDPANGTLDRLTPEPHS